jgi:ubiquinone biosynthesis protein UbiJ
MVFEMIIGTLLVSAEGIINPLILSDPVASKRLSSMAGQVAAFEVQDLNTCIYLIPTTAGIQLQTLFDGEPDVVLRGKCITFMSLATSDDPKAHFFGNGIEVTGQLGLAQAIQTLLADLNIDWEGLLANAVGDLPAHHITEWMRFKNRFAQQAHASLKSSSVEYLVEESGLLPSRPEVEHFMDEVDSLRQRTDRLMARIDQLKSNQP